MSDNDDVQNDIQALEDMKKALVEERDTIDAEVAKIDEGFDSNPDVAEFNKAADELENVDAEAQQEEDAGTAQATQESIDAM